MEAHSKNLLNRANDTLLASWAVTQRCNQIIKEIPGQITFQWVKRFAVRHMFAVLPTAKYANWNNPAIADRCPFCTEIETNSHFLTCPNNSGWRKELIAAVDTMVHSSHCSIHISLRLLMQDGIRHAFRGTNVDPTQHSNSVQGIILHQTKIGWTEMLRGKFASTWSCDLVTPDNHHTTTEWIHDIASLMFTATREAWYAHVKYMHGSTHEEQKNNMRQTAEKELRYLYTQRDLVLPPERRLYQTRVEDDLASSTTTAIQNWVNVFKPLIIASVKEAKKRSQQPRITNWFQQAQASL